MPEYRIFAGLAGGFGGAHYQFTEEFANETDASDAAYECAVGEYESYGGMHGLFNEVDALEENPDLTEEELSEMAQEDLENWIEYWTVLVGSEEDTEDYED